MCIRVRVYRPLLTVLLVVSVATIGVGSRASASLQPTLQWRLLSADIQAATAPVVAYDSRDLPRDTTLYVQERRRGRWVRIFTSHAARTGTGHIKLPRLSEGRYLLRVIVRGGKPILVAPGSRLLTVFSPVPFSRLLGTKESTATVGRVRFVYAWSAAHWANYTLVSLPSATCRSLSLDLAYVDPSRATSQTTLDIAQLSHLKKIAAFAGHIRHAVVSLSRGGFQLDLQTDTGIAYGNGTADCWTPSGRTPVSAAHVAQAKGLLILNDTSAISNPRPSPAKHLIPAPGIYRPQGVHYICSSAGYRCALHGYAPTSPKNSPYAGEWWFDDFGPGQASENKKGLHNCTLYAGYMLYLNGLTSRPLRLKNAQSWANEAYNSGGKATISQTPSIGDIAQWNVPAGGTFGHVAYVEDVVGNTITLTDDNYYTGGGAYAGGYTDEFTITKGSPYWPDNFIDFHTPKGAASNALTSNQAAGLTYVDRIVKWTGDVGQVQPASWLVTITAVPSHPGLYVPMRHWIPTESMYECLIYQDGAKPWPSPLPASILSNQIPDDYGNWATCNMPAYGVGGGGLRALISEQAGHFGAPTFSNIHSASGAGVSIGAGHTVTVSCKAYDPTISSADPGGYWYLIASYPWDDQYFAPANVFMNGDPWNGPYTHNTDLSVPDCATTTPPPPPREPPIALGQPSISIGWSSAHPSWITMTVSGFSPGSYTYACDFGSGGDTSYTVSISSNPQTFDNGQTCYDAVPGDTVWVTINGVTSNTLTVAS